MESAGFFVLQSILGAGALVENSIETSAGADPTGFVRPIGGAATEAAPLTAAQCAVLPWRSV